MYLILAVVAVLVALLVVYKSDFRLKLKKRTVRDLQFHVFVFIFFGVPILVFVAGGILFVRQLSTPSEPEPGVWPDSWTASSMPVEVLRLTAGQPSNDLRHDHLYGAIANPHCFVWSAPHGQRSVRFLSEVVTDGVRGPTNDGNNFAECVYRGQRKRVRLRLTSTVDQDILVGWPTLSPQGGGLRPGFNSYETLQQYVK